MEPTTHIIEGLHYLSGKPVRLTIGNGVILEVEEPAPSVGPALSGEPGSRKGSGPGHPATERLPVIAPGLVDIQVNGFMGVDFNDPDLTAGQVETASTELLRRGVTGYFPTLITGPVERITSLLRVFRKAMRMGGWTAKMVKGIHLEGPFISREEGPRGAHPLQYCLDPDPGLVKRWQEAAGGMIRLLTLAPELPGSEAVIRMCRQTGIVVGIAHTDAGRVDIRMAADAGATLSTHLGNGCHAMLPRHPNYLWDQLADDRLYASMIADGFHLPDAVLKVFTRVKGHRAILVSDSMNFSGMPPGLYHASSTGKVRLTPQGKLHLADRPETLAGSASLLMDGVRRMARLEGLVFALEMASVHPSCLMNLPTRNGLAKGAPADLVILESDEKEVKLVSVFCQGTSP